MNLRRHLIAECHLNFEKLLSSSIITLANIENEDHKGIDVTKPCIVEFSEKLWHYGNQVGKVTGSFKMLDLPFLSQMRIGVLDNHGVHFSTKTFSQNNSKIKGKKHRQLENLSQWKQKIINRDRRVKHLKFEDACDLLD